MNNIEELLKACDIRQTFNIQLKTFKEKVKSDLTYGFNGGIFYIDRSLLNFIDMLISKNRIHGVIILDINDNPILVDDLEKFQNEIFDRYFTVVNEYYEFYQNIKKSRTVEKIIGYE